jgi:hypothetical protein
MDEWTNWLIDETAQEGRLSGLLLSLQHPSLEPTRAQASEGKKWKHEWVMERIVGDGQPRPGVVDQREGHLSEWPVPYQPSWAVRPVSTASNATKRRNRGVLFTETCLWVPPTQ